jgi:hypothetical protein
MANKVQIADSTDVGLGTATNPLITSGVSGVPSVNTANSSAVALTGGAAFTGTAVDVSGYSSINVSVFADQASATNGLSMQQSSDATNWDVVDAYTVPLMTAGNGKTYSVQVAARYFRVVYTNGATPNTLFRLQTMLKTGTGPTSSNRPSDGYSNENDFQQTQAFDMVWNGASWDRLKAAPYQTAQTPIIGKSGNVANASAAATLTGTASTTVYISGFEITGAGATAGLPVTVTVAGLLGGTIQYTYDFAVGALVGNLPLIVEYLPPLPASAVNTAIVVTCPASGTGGTNNTVVAHGFYQ